MTTDDKTAIDAARLALETRRKLDDMRKKKSDGLTALTAFYLGVIVVAWAAAVWIVITGGPGL